MSFTHENNEATSKRFHPERRPELRDELSNNSELRKHMNVNPRLNGARLSKSSDPRRDEWVFWEKKDDSSSG